jgi:hypothetical protein
VAACRERGASGSCCGPQGGGGGDQPRDRSNKHRVKCLRLVHGKSLLNADYVRVNNNLCWRTENIGTRPAASDACIVVKSSASGVKAVCRRVTAPLPA